MSFIHSNFKTSTETEGSNSNGLFSHVCTKKERTEIDSVIRASLSQIIGLLPCTIVNRLIHSYSIKERMSSLLSVILKLY